MVAIEKVNKQIEVDKSSFHKSLEKKTMWILAQELGTIGQKGVYTECEHFCVQHQTKDDSVGNLLNGMANRTTRNSFTK